MLFQQRSVIEKSIFFVKCLPAGSTFSELRTAMHSCRARMYRDLVYLLVHHRPGENGGKRGGMVGLHSYRAPTGQPNFTVVELLVLHQERRVRLVGAPQARASSIVALMPVCQHQLTLFSTQMEVKM